MSKHLSAKQVEDYQQRQLPPEDLLAADDHLAECSECRNVVRSPMNTAAVTVYADLASETSVAEHPSFEQKAAYVEGLLTGDARRMIEDHLASCAQCAPQVADLRTFRNQIAPEMDREFLPGDLAQGAKLQRNVDQSSRTLSPPLLKIPGWIYAVAPALLLLALAAWVAWKSTTSKATDQLAVASPTPAPTPAPTIAPVLVPTLAPSSVDSQIAADIEKWPFDINDWRVLR